MADSSKKSFADTAGGVENNFVRLIGIRFTDRFVSVSTMLDGVSFAQFMADVLLAGPLLDWQMRNFGETLFTFSARFPYACRQSIRKNFAQTG